MPPRKILYFITKANWGGAQRYTYDLATALRDQGHEVLVAYGTPGLLADKLAEAGIRTERLSAVGREVSLGRDSRAFGALLTLLRRERPDILHVNSSKAGALGTFAGRLAGVPRIIFTAHGWAWNEDRPLWQKALIRAIAYITVLLSHETICVSNAMRDAAKWMPFARRKLQVVKNGVRVPAFVSKEEARMRLAPELTASMWIGMLSELHPTKRIADAVEAFASLARTYPDLALVIIGGGQERTDLELMIHERDLASRIILTGFVEDGARYLPAFDLFIQASRSESFCLAVAEAGLASLPVVATRVGGIPEIVESRKNGLLVPPLRPDLIALALTEYLEEPDRAQAYGAALKERVASRFPLERMVEETERIYS